jgi:hypothetical protein
MHHPGLVAEGLAGRLGQPALGQGVEELGAEDVRGRFHRDEEIGPTGQPPLAVFAEGSAGHQEVQVRVITQIAAPGVQHAGKPQPP